MTAIEPPAPPHPAETRTQVEMTPAAPAPGWMSQATAVEQSRAVAEVQGAIVVAQQIGRDVTRARAQLQETCGRMAFAERAFWSYKRGRDTINGLTIQFARAAAAWWGHIQYGISELRRDDDGAMSEMSAWAWDVLANTRASSSFLVPHLRDRSEGGPQRLTALRDIYENNANQGARRLREQILAVLPDWFVAEGRDICTVTLKGDDKRSVKDRQLAAAKAFEAEGIAVGRLEQKLGRPVDRWTIYDMTQLRIMLREIQTAVAFADELFPPLRVTAGEIGAQHAAMGIGAAPQVPDPSPSHTQGASEPVSRDYAPDDPERPM